MNAKLSTFLVASLGLALQFPADACTGITLKSKDEIYNLFTMTPYYYKSSKESMNKLLSKDSLNTRVSFVLLVYQKVGE